MGYLKKVCNSKTKNVNNLEQDILDNVDLNLGKLFNLEATNVNFVKPFCIKLDIDKEVVKFQVSAVTVMSKNDLGSFGIEDLENLTDVSLRV